MPGFQAEVAHALGRDEAANRLKNLLEKVRQKYGDQVSNLQETWRDDGLDFSFRTYGFNIKGSVAVDDQNVKLTGELPFAAMMFKGRIEQSIREEIDKALSRPV